MDRRVVSVNNISELPDEVIWHILSFLHNVNDAVRTSVLSQRWRQLWYSFATLVFDARRFTAGIGHQDDSNNKEMMFRNHVSASLSGHLERKSYIHKLVMYMTSFDPEANTPFLNNVLEVAINKGIRELDLHVSFENSKRYTLSQTVFFSEALTGIRLTGCKLEICHNIKLPNLQKLYLCKVPLAAHIIHNLIDRCPSIEDLRFIKCSVLKLLHVSKLVRLNRVEIHHCHQLKRVQIGANLHTFWYWGRISTPCKVRLEGYTSLKALTLDHPQVIRDFCKNQFSEFDSLEKLDLTVSNKIRFIHISNGRLQKLALKGCNKLGSALVHAPNLLSFKCKGEMVPWINIDPFCLTYAKLSFILKSEIEVGGLCGDEIWFRMKDFIRKFDSKEFKLVLYSNKNILIHDDLDNVTLPPVADLSCEIIKTSATSIDVILSRLLRRQPVSLSIISPVDSIFPLLVFETINIGEEDPTCCRYNSSNNKCWRHFLKNVDFDNLEIENGDRGEEGDRRNCTWYKWLKSVYTTLECGMTNLRLDWKYQEIDIET